MGSKREVERNEKIIRGLMKLPPNRRCINCNSLGPQYVCTNFWTFICMPCSGVHREFTHRVKSVSMAKFTVQEVDALQKGGNQRARELFLKAWDPQRQRLPDNSNPDKVREFIKNVYVDKRYAIEKLSDKPPTDRQSLSHEDETRKASSYHSYSQSPPYDFQYEERRYGKPVSSLSRKPGSDHALYDGKLSSFSSPGHSSDQANDERFANDGSCPRVSDYSVSSGGDPFRSGVFSPGSHKETWSPFSESETSSSFSSDMHGHHIYSHNSNAQGGSRRGHPQRTASSGSFGSFDSMSFKSVNSTGLQEVVSEAQKTVDMPLENAASFPSLPKSSPSTVLNGLDLFNEPFASQNTTYTPKTDCNSQSRESFSSQPLDLFQQSGLPSSLTLTEKQPLEILKPSALNFTVMPQQESIASLSDKTSEVAVLQKGGWATFDVSLNLLNMGSQDSVPAALPSSDGNNLLGFNPFSLDQSTPTPKPPTVELAASTHTPWHDSLQNAETTKNDTQFWNAFEDYPVTERIDYALKVIDQTPAPYSNDSISVGGGVHEVLHSDGNFTTSYGIEPPTSMALHNFPLVTEAAGVHPVATVQNHTNPFDLPCEVDVESNNTFWDMSSMQAALPNNQAPDANESWFPLNSVPPFIPGGVAFDPPNAGPLGYIVGQAPSTQIPNGPAQGPFASVGGNPFA